jgi:hypothetical protein
MCDYSLVSVASRPAKVGDKLVTSAFPKSSTRGFATVGEEKIVVCLKLGTEIAFEKEAEYRHPFARIIPGFRFGKLGGRVARFRKVNFLETAAHHDALEFADGKICSALASMQRCCRLLQIAFLQKNPFTDKILCGFHDVTCIDKGWSITKTVGSTALTKKREQGPYCVAGRGESF